MSEGGRKGGREGGIQGARDPGSEGSRDPRKYSRNKKVVHYSVYNMDRPVSGYMPSVTGSQLGSPTLLFGKSTHPPPSTQTARSRAAQFLIAALFWLLGCGGYGAESCFPPQRNISLQAYIYIYIYIYVCRNVYTKYIHIHVYIQREKLFRDFMGSAQP